MLASTFVFGGINGWKSASTLVPAAEPVASPIAKRLGTSASTEQLVKANAAVQIVGGVLFALGVAPRVLAVILGASLVPTTLAGHRFWETDDPVESERQRTQFMKNAGLLGGLFFAVLDTGGRPSIFWSGRKAAEGIASSVEATTASVIDSVGLSSQ